MPRPLRNFATNEVYHLINRGVDSREIFSTRQDYSRFILGLELFNSKDAANIWDIVSPNSKVGSDLSGRLNDKRKANVNRIVELMAFALMPNHYHLLAREIVPGGIILFMKKLGGYASYYNKQRHRVGSLFQSRYKAILQDDETQLANTFAYIHTNPVELIEPGWKDDFEVKNPGKALEFLNDYRWSSHLDYLGRGFYANATQRTFFTDYLGGSLGCKKIAEEWIKFKASKHIDKYQNYAS